jgi:hypothetical protein
MFKLSGAAASGAAPMLMTRAAQAEVPMAATMPAAFKRFKLGDFEITGAVRRPPVWCRNRNRFSAPMPRKEEVEALLAENYLPVDQMQFTFAPTLINTGNELILFDTGNGEGGREGGVGQTLANLQASGYTPDQVTHVVITHMHPGSHRRHDGRRGVAAYPNAAYVTGQAEYDFWTSEDRDRHAGRARPFDGQGEGPAVGGEDDLHRRRRFGRLGHHRHERIRSHAGPHDLCGRIRRPDDGDHGRHREPLRPVAAAPGLGSGVRRRQGRCRGDAQEGLRHDRDRSLPFIGYHMPFPSVGYVEKMGEGYRFIPETYQLDL